MDVFEKQIGRLGHLKVRSDFCQGTVKVKIYHLNGLHRFSLSTPKCNPQRHCLSPLDRNFDIIHITIHDTVDNCIVGTIVRNLRPKCMESTCTNGAIYQVKFVDKPQLEWDLKYMILMAVQLVDMDVFH